MKRIGMLFAGISMLIPVQAAGIDSTQLKHYGVEVSVQPGAMIAADYYEKKWLKGKFAMAAGAGLRYSALPQDSDAYAIDFGYPVFSANIKYNWNHGVTMHREKDEAWGMLEPVDYTSRMGNAVSVYGTFERPLIRSRKWQADYSLSFGVGYTKSKYNTYDAIDNELIGSRWLIYFGTGLHATYRFAKDWGLRAGVDFYHHSNGAMNRPNKGANVVAPSMGVVYEPYYEEVAMAGRSRVRMPFDGFTFLDFSASVGIKTLHEDWQLTQFGTPPGAPGYRTSKFKAYPTYSLQVSVLRRYARRWASGAGIDVFCVSYAHRVREIDELYSRTLRHDPWSLGVSAKHRVYYRNLSLNLSVGYYLYRALGDNANQIEGPVYEHVGLHYSFSGLHGLSIGVDVKAHATKADYTAVTLSYPVTL